MADTQRKRRGDGGRERKMRQTHRGRGGEMGGETEEGRKRRGGMEGRNYQATTYLTNLMCF